MHCDELVKVIAGMENNDKYAQIASNYLFLRKITLPYVAEHYKRFLYQHGIINAEELAEKDCNNKIAIGISRKICGKREFYLDGPDFCWVGYVCVPDMEIISEEFPRSNGSVVSCKDIILKRDPELRQNPNIVLMPENGIAAVINVKGREYVIPETFMDSYMGTARRDMDMKRVYREILNTKRGILKLICRHLAEADDIKDECICASGLMYYTVKNKDNRYELREFFKPRTWGNAEFYHKDSRC